MEELETLAQDMEALSVLSDEELAELFPNLPVDERPVTMRFSQSPIDISVNEFAEETPALDSLDQTIDEKSFSVPEINENMNFSANVPSATVDPGFPAVPFNGSETFNLDFPDTFRTAVIQQGSFELSITVPSSWSNVQVTADVQLVQGANVLGSDSGASPLQVDLAGRTLNPVDVTLNYTLNFSPINSAQSMSITNDDLDCSALIDIASFSSMTVSTPLSDLQQVVTEEMGEETTDFVETINFNDPRLEIRAINTLPAQVNITINSTALDVSNAVVSFPAGSSDEVLRQVSLLATDSMTLTQPTHPIDMTIDVEIVGYDTATETLVLNQTMNAGETYSFSGRTDAVMDVESMVIRTVDLPAEQNPPAGEDGHDFTMINDMFPANVTFSEIESYFEMASVDGISLTLNFWVTHDGSGTPIYALGSATDRVTISGDSILPLSDDFNNLINQRATGVYSHYHITVTGATIFADPNQDQRITAKLVTNLPMVLHADGNAELRGEDGSPIIPPAEGDLLNRDEPMDEDTREFMDFITAMSVNMTYDNSLGLTAGIEMIETSPPLGYENFEKTLYVQPGADQTLALEMNQQEIQYILDDDAFMPEYNMFLPDSNLPEFGDVSFYQNGDISVNLYLEVQSDVDYTIELGGE